MARISVGGEQSTAVDRMVIMTPDGPRLARMTTREMLEHAVEAPGRVFIVALDRYQVIDIERGLEELTQDRARFTILRLSQHRDLRGKSGRVFVDQAVLDAGRGPRQAEVEALLLTSQEVDGRSRQIGADYDGPYGGLNIELIAALCVVVALLVGVALVVWP